MEQNFKKGGKENGLHLGFEMEIGLLLENL
jgi:hypothetical protein